MKTYITKAKERMSEQELSRLQLMADNKGITLDQMIERLCKAVIYNGEINRLVGSAT